MHFCCLGDFTKFVRQGPHEDALWWASARLKKSNSNLRTCCATALSIVQMNSIREPQPKPNDDFNKGTMLNSLIVNLAEEVSLSLVELLLHMGHGTVASERTLDH